MLNKAEKIAKSRSTEPRHKMMKIFIYLEEIFNGPTTKGDGLKILTPNQMLSRLPITIAQLKQEIILKNLKMKLDNYYILCTDQKNLQSNSIKV